MYSAFTESDSPQSAKVGLIAARSLTHNCSDFLHHAISLIVCMNKYTVSQKRVPP